jgi:hypothetical protein
VEGNSIDFPERLFRGLRLDEVAAGNVPLSKSLGPFLAHPRLPIRLPFVLGERVEHAVREHQWGGKYITSGISTSPLFERASIYGAQTGVVVEIDTTKFTELGVEAYKVADHVNPEFIVCPEDQEVILCYREGEPLPREIIHKIHCL